MHAEGARLRELAPAVRIELPGGVLAWSINSYAHIRKILTDKRVSKDPRQHWPAFINGEIGLDWPLISWLLMDNMTTAYGKDHVRLRTLISKAFTARRVESLRPRVVSIVDELLDELARTPPGEVVDFKARFANPLPARMICELFGVPEDQRADVLQGGEKTTESNLTPEEAEANFLQWQGALARFVDYKRANPGDDMATDLIAAQNDDGSRLNDSELVGTLFLTLGAGSETVMNLLCHAVLSLITHPEQRELATSGQVSWTAVVEETLRVQGPIAQLPIRFAIEDIEFDGVTIRQGDPILIGFAQAGRDPNLHGETATQFDITRTNKEHLALGHGAHFCMGAALARLEAEIALPTFFNRFPHAALAIPRDTLESQGTFIMNGHRELPLLLKA